MKKQPTQKELEQEASEWNDWQPASGRKGWSPFGTKKFERFEVERMGDIPLKNGKIDMERWEEELKK